MELTPDTVVYWQIAGIRFTATIVNTWIVMAFLISGAWLITRKFSVDAPRSHWQNFAESLVTFANATIRDVIQKDPNPYLAFVGTLFIFIACSNLMAVIPQFRAPTSSLYTTGVLALIVFLAVPVFGIKNLGIQKFVKHYFEPSLIMFPFNVTGEISRTLALAVRLFGNMLSGGLISSILLTFIPVLFPVIFDLFSMLIGMIQAYIFAMLATVYIGSGTQAANYRK